jgi:flavin reductase (DIM6/NTAB) family NADH-FMN oxidoreductase RutF
MSAGAGKTVTQSSADELVELPPAEGLWQRVFSVAPLVLIGTREADGYDFAPKHMAMPLGWDAFYCFACSPRHSTYANVVAERAFTVSFPRPEQILDVSFAAGGRVEDGTKPSLHALDTFPARVVDGRLVRGCAFYLECELDRVVDGFGPSSLVVGRVVAAAAAAEALRTGETDDADLIHRLALLAYLAPGRFAAVRESLSFPYTFDFRL